MDLHGGIEALFKRMLKPESIVPATPNPTVDTCRISRRSNPQKTIFGSVRLDRPQPFKISGISISTFLNPHRRPLPTEYPILRGQKSGNEISQIEGGAAHSIKNNKKADNSFELSALVAGEGLEPPTFGL